MVAVECFETNRSVFARRAVREKPRQANLESAGYDNYRMHGFQVPDMSVHSASKSPFAGGSTVVVVVVVFKFY